MESAKILVVFTIIGQLVTVNARLNCQTYGEKDVVCTASGDSYVLRRGLVSDNIKISGITLRNCRITDVDYEAFHMDIGLRYIDLSVNSISSLKVGVLDGGRGVTHLNMSYNLLTTFPLGLFNRKSNLYVLDLKGNTLNFLEVGVFDPLQKLTHLDLSSNSLLGKNLNPQLFENIKFLDFSRNDMSDTPVNLLQGILQMDLLNLDRCSLKEVPSFATRPNLKSMKHLLLSTNQISKIDKAGTFVNLDNLEIINLAENVIEDIGTDVFKTLHKLKFVILRNNRLKTVPDGLFLNLKAIDNVDFSYNLIEHVPVNAFQGTPALKILNLSHNRFTYLDANFCLELRNSGVRLNKFYFNDNPWQCACLNEVLKEMKTYNVRYSNGKYNGGYAVCVTTKIFNCKRQLSDNAIFIEMFDNNKNEQ